ncbi:MAG: amino acid ABC transporter substrate-binding protein [Cellulosilyticaceae bacterium]
MKIKNVFKSVLVGTLAFTMMVGMVGCTKVGSTGLEGVKERGKLVVGLDDQFAPMGFRDEKGELAGFDIDLANEVGRRMGVDVELKPIVWDTKEVTLNNGEIDLIWNGYTITPAREEKVLFTAPYLENKQMIIVKEDSPIKTIADLAGKNVGLQLGSSAQDAVEKNAEAAKSFKEMKKYENNVEVLLDLEIGGVDAAVMDSVVGYYYIKKNDYPFVVLEEDFGDELYGIGGRKEDKTLIEAINVILDEMRADGTYDEISGKWFDK